MEKIIINDKEVELKEITFKSFKQLEKLGFTINSLVKPEENYWSTISALTAYHMGITADEADEEIEKHLENNGNIDFAVKMIEAMQNSDFFHKLANNKK